MTPAELALNIAVLAIVLLRNLGVRAVTRRRFTIPATIIVVIGFIFLRHIPTRGHDVRFDVAGIAAGVLLGAVAGVLLKVELARNSQLQTRAGAGFAALWIVVIAARVAFSEGATHIYTKQVTNWSIGHRITGANAFTAMFVLMALAMIAAMTVILGVRSAAARHGHPLVRTADGFA